jgi:CubicO group peptidase (beta-lactamase class C family)
MMSLRHSFACGDAQAFQSDQRSPGQRKRVRAARALLVGLASLAAPDVPAMCTGTYFPAQGDTLTVQSQKTPTQVGLKSGIPTALQNTIKSYPAGAGYAACTLPTAARWALWRHGRLVLYRGSFTANSEIKSARKTIHAATIGALIQMGKIAADQTLSHHVKNVWNAQPSTVPTGNCDLNATLKQVLVQISGYSDPAKCPGQEWHYHDSNPPVINRIAARAYRGTNATDYNTNYNEILGGPLFNKVKATDWTTTVQSDGIRIGADLPDLGRFGVLMVNDGQWAATQVVPRWFVTQMSQRQTTGIPPDYTGDVVMNPAQFLNSPYSLLTWTNSNRDLYGGRNSTWTLASGAGGHYVIWDRGSGIVMVILDSNRCFYPPDLRVGGGATKLKPVIDVLEANISGADPFAGSCT